MLDNLIKIYLNQDGSLKNSNIDPIYKLSNQSVIVELVAPFANTSGVYAKFLLSNNAASPVRTMQLMGTELVEGDTWNRWQYRMPSSILASASKLQAQSFLVSFFIQDLPFVVSDGFRFQGFFDTLTDLQIAVPQPSLSQPVDFAGVSGGLISEQAVLYAGGSIGQAVGWTTQPSVEDPNVPKTVQEFVEENNIERVNRSRSTTQVKVAIAPSVAGTTGEIEIVDVTQTAIIANRLAAIEGSLADIEANYVRADFELANYAEVSQLVDDDQFFMNYGNYQDPRYVEASQIKSYAQQGVEFVANKGQPDGYTPLDGAGKIDGQYLPDQLYFFRGTFGSVDSTTGGDLPSNPTLGDAYICDLPSFFSQEAQIEFFLQDKAIWDGDEWDKVPGFGLVPEAPVDGTMYGRQEGQWIDVLTAIGPYLFKRDITITEPNTVTLNVGLSEFEPEDTVFVYENGILLIEGINYSFDNQTGVITFLTSGQPGDATYNIPDIGSIITIQLIKRSVFSGLATSASNISFDSQQINLIDANNVQLAIQQLVEGVYTQTQLQTPEQALISGANVAGLTPQTSILDDLEAITWKGTLPNVLALGNIVDPANGDVYAILQEQTIYIRRNNTWAPILAQGQLPQDGVNGDDAVFGFLTQPASVLTQDANFDIVFTGSGSDIFVFEGNTQLTPQLGVSAQPGEFNVILDQANNITAGALTVPSGADFVRLGDHSQLADITQPAFIRLRIEGRRNNGDTFQFFLNQSVALAPRVPGPAGADGVDGVDGVDGQDGVDGTSVVLKGSVATVPDLDLILNPQVGDLYVVLADGNGYVWDGSNWNNVGQIQGPAGADGADGADGTNGTDGVDGADGNNFAVVSLYQRTDSATPPSTPTNLSGEYNFTTASLTAISGNLQGFGTEIPALIDPDDRFLWTSTFTLSSTTNPLTFSGINPSAPRLIAVSGTDGQNGDAGPEGPQGPGIVYRGLWDATKTYFRTPTRADVVSAFTGNPATLKYYIALQQSFDINPTNTGFWQLFENQFDMVATNILLTDNATITRGLVIGSEGSNAGFIRSTNSSAINSGTGFFMNNNGDFSLGSTSGNNGLYWNGSLLDINGDIGGTIGKIVVGNITFDNTGITATDGAATPVVKFNLDAITGNGTFSGIINASSGTIGGATFVEGAVGGQVAFETTNIKATGTMQTQVLQVNNTAFIQNGIISTGDVVPNGGFKLGRPASERWNEIWGIDLYGTLQGTSDIRLKEQVEPIKDKYKAFVLENDMIQFKYKGEDSLEFGINANEFINKFGEDGSVIVTTREDGYYQAAYSRFIPILMQLVKDQHEEIEVLKERLTDLENKEG